MPTFQPHGPTMSCDSAELQGCQYAPGGRTLTRAALPGAPPLRPRPAVPCPAGRHTGSVRKRCLHRVTVSLPPSIPPMARTASQGVASPSLRKCPHCCLMLTSLWPSWFTPPTPTHRTGTLLHRSHSILRACDPVWPVACAKCGLSGPVPDLLLDPHLIRSLATGTHVTM